MKVDFYEIDEINDEQITFVVIVSKYKGKWVLVRHQDRSTWEIPGGHKELFEDLSKAAERELFEESGAKEFDLKPIGIYSVENNGTISFGKLFFSEIKTLGELPGFEIKEIKMVDDILEEQLTYPLIQPVLLERIKNKGF